MHYCVWYDLDTDLALLDEYCKQADFVFHLLEHRPKEQSEFIEGNLGYFKATRDVRNTIIPVQS